MPKMSKQAPGQTLRLKLGALRSFLGEERWSRSITLLKAALRAAVQHPRQLFIMVAAATVGFILLRELNRDVAFIGPLGIPSFAEELGFSDEVGAYRLRDDVLRISDRARRTIYGGDNVDRSALFGTEVSFLPIGDRLDFEVPVLDLSFQSILALFKEFWGIRELKIAGEFVCSPRISDWECPSRKELRLRVRVFGFGERVHLIDMGTMENRGLDQYFLETAEEILALIEPYTLARYYYRAATLCGRSRRVAVIVECYKTREAYLDEAEEIAGTLTVPGHDLQGLGFEMRGLVASQRGFHRVADRLLERAAALAPDELKPQVYNSWGVILGRAGNYVEALEKYKIATERRPNLQEAHNNMAYALTELGDYDEAERMYTVAIEIDETYATAYYNRGVLRRLRCDFEGAASDHETATEIDGMYHRAFSGLGFALRRLKRYPEANAAYARAHKLRPESYVTLLNWGVALAEASDEEEALLKFEAALALKPDYDRAHFHIGTLAEEKGDLEGALESYRRAVGIRRIKDDDDRRSVVDVHESMARVLEMLGRSSEAKHHHEEAQRLRAELTVPQSCS